MTRCDVKNQGCFATKLNRLNKNKYIYQGPEPNHEKHRFLHTKTMFFDGPCGAPGKYIIFVRFVPTAENMIAPRRGCQRGGRPVPNASLVSGTSGWRSQTDERTKAAFERQVPLSDIPLESAGFTHRFFFFPFFSERFSPKKNCARSQ